MDRHERFAIAFRHRIAGKDQADVRARFDRERDGHRSATRREHMRLADAGLVVAALMQRLFIGAEALIDRDLGSWLPADERERALAPA